MLLQLSWFFPHLPPSSQCPYSLRQSPHHCSCPWVTCVSSLASLFPILSFTSPWLFCNYLFVLLNPLTSSPILPLLLPIWQPSGNELLFSCCFKSLSLSLTFGLLIMMYLGEGLFASTIIGTPQFLDLKWRRSFIHQIREVFFHYFFR